MLLRHYLSISTVLRVIFLFFKNFTNFKIAETVIFEKNILGALNSKSRKWKQILHFEKNQTRKKVFCQRLIFFIFSFLSFLCKFAI